MVFTNYVCVNTSHIFCFFFSLLLTLQKLQCLLFDSHETLCFTGCTVVRGYYRKDFTNNIDYVQKVGFMGCI